MKKILSLVVVLVLLIGSSAPFFTSMSPAAAEGDESESFSPELAEQVAEIYQQKQSLTPVQRKIDSRIIEVVREVEERISSARPGETPKLQDLSTPLLKIDDAGNIEVKLTVTSLTAEQLEQLEALGMNIRLTLPKYGVIEGSLPYDQVEAVAALDSVVNVGTPGYGLRDTGDVTSGGDTVLKAAEARAAFGVDGGGVKVGVISDGVTHLSDSVATGDLPSSPAVDVLKAGDGDEGTAMLEIIHDLAPGSPLGFYAPDTSSDMVAGIAALEAAACKVIVDDLTWSDEPKFEDGPIAQEARAFYSGGGVYVTSAGNSAQRHYMGTYVRTGGPGGGYDYAHDYGGGDVGNTFTILNGGSIVTLLQWNNQWEQSGDDFGLVLHRSSDQAILAASDNYQTGNGNPWEGLTWTNDTGSAVTVFIAVWEWSLVSVPSSLILDYHVWYGSGLQYVTPENSVIGHSAVEEVLSTAAADVATPDTIESFSSRGPGTVYFPSQEDRQVPNITGVDGVHTKTGELGHFSDPFYGTSASAPHVAAIAALVWQADPTLTSSGVLDALTSTAVDLGPAGWDDTWGFGRVDAYEAVASVAGQLDTTPPEVTITLLVPDPTNDNTPTFTGTATDTESNISSVEYKVDDRSWTAASASDGAFDSLSEDYTFTTSALSDGAHTVYVRATDAATNTTAEANYASDSFTVDATAPSVTSTSPPADATDVAIDTTVSVTFSEAMDASTITTSSFTLDSVSGSVSYDSSTYTATFTPSANLSYSTTYTATLSTAITDAGGNPLASAYSWNFTTVAEVGVIVSVDAPDEAAPDSDFTANVNISAVVDFDACNYDVSFDASVLRLDDVTSGLIGSTTIPVDMYNEISSGTYRIIQNVAGLAGVSGSGYLAVLHFHVIGSEGSSSTISLSNGMLANNLAEEIPATWIGDTVDVTSVLPGDANGDGNINALDIVKVERIMAGLDAQTPGADANQDGSVNALDITKIELIIGGLG